MKNKNFFNRKGHKSFRSFLRNKATSAESTNQPPRPQIDFVISDFICTAAAPPSKGGETFSTVRFYNSTLKLTPMPEGGAFETHAIIMFITNIYSNEKEVSYYSDGCNFCRKFSPCFSTGGG